MSLLRRLLLRQFVPIFLVAILFFVLLLQLMDIFGSIWRYVAHDVPVREVAKIALLYVPKCVSYALPVSFLFAIAYSLGILYANNELFAIFCSGTSLHRLVLPFLFLGALFSVGSFYFEDSVVIPTFRTKNDLYAVAVKQMESLSQSNVTVTSPDQRVIYQADYYNDAQTRLNGLTVVIRDEKMSPTSRIDASWAEWSKTRWVLHDCRIFTVDPATGLVTDVRMPSYDSPQIVEPPDTFRKLARNIEEMSAGEAGRYVALIRKAGLFYWDALTDYYRKYSFACTPFVVAFIASSLGSTFKKNILLMSLLSSLVISVVFYVAQMVAAILSKNQIIPPLAGAWSPFSLFLLLGFVLFRTART
ncbi:MAG TPA: LptF/LptG family permease [Spirochaetia bacterium]|nr:LptF/LptG family permease [Spirochaetia bacterium]